MRRYVKNFFILDNRIIAISKGIFVQPFPKMDTFGWYL